MKYAASLAEYIALRVVEDGGCLRWTGTLWNGHPGGTFQGQRLLIRRAQWEAKHGPIPPGKLLRCTCETPLCVLDEHTKLVTRAGLMKELGALGLLSGPVRSARIAATKRAGAQAKTTQENVRAIRASNEAGTVLAARLNISETLVSAIRCGRRRREFTDNPWQGLAC